MCSNTNCESSTNYRAAFAVMKLINEHTRLREIWPRKIVLASPDKQSIGHEKRKMKDEVFKTKGLSQHRQQFGQLTPYRVNSPVVLVKYISIGRRD